MPRYTAKVAAIKADRLMKPYTRNGFNQSATARKLGITPSAVCQRLSKKPVQDALQRYINSPSLKRKLVSVANEALSATKGIRIALKDKNGKKTFRITTGADHDARHKFWHDLCQAGGILKANGEGGVKIINIVHAYRKEKDATTRM